MRAKASLAGSQSFALTSRAPRDCEPANGAFVCILQKERGPSVASACQSSWTRALTLIYVCFLRMPPTGLACTVAASNESPACLSFHLEELRRILCCSIQTTVCTPLPVALSLFYRYSLRNEGAKAAPYLRSSEFDAAIARGSLPSFIGVCLSVLRVSFLPNELCQWFLVAFLF